MDYGSKAEATVVQMSDQGTFRQAGRHGLPGCFSCLPAGRLVLLSLSKDLQKQKRTNEKLDSSPAFSVIRMTKRSD
jgi:hypothetical protein